MPITGVLLELHNEEEIIICKEFEKIKTVVEGSISDI